MDIVSLVVGIVLLLFFVIYCTVPFSLACKRFKREKAANPTLEYVRPNVGIHILHFVTHILGIAMSVCVIVSVLPGVWGCLGAFAFFWIIYIIAGCFSAQYKAMANMRSVAGAATFMQRLRATGPVLVFHVRCWHIEHYTTSYTDRDGHRHVEHHTREVTTYRSTHPVPIPFWRDDTPALFLPSGRLMIHVKIRKLIIWEHGSEGLILQLLRRLYLLNCWRDVHCDVWQEQFIPGLIPENMVLNGDASQMPPAVRTYTRVLYAIFWSALTYAYDVAALASVVRQVVVKHASLIAPVVDPNWCAKFGIDMSTVRPTAPVIDPNMVSNWSPGETAASTANIAPPPPCIENPLPLTTIEPPTPTFETSWNSATDKMDAVVANFAPPADIQNDVNAMKQQYGNNMNKEGL